MSGFKRCPPPMAHEDVMGLLTLLALADAAVDRGQDPEVWMTPLGVTYWRSWRAGKDAAVANYDEMVRRVKEAAH